MPAVNITGFQRARRLAAAKARASESETARQEAENVEKTSTDVPPENTGKDSKKSENVSRGTFEGLTSEDAAALNVDQVKDFLTHYGVNFAHNTGEEKLREKLNDAIN